MKIAFCTGWETEKDGISDYSRHLVGELKKNGAAIQIIKLGYYVDNKRYYRELAERANSADLCHIQYNYVYFNGELPYRNRFSDFARFLKIPFVITAHEVRIGYEPIVSGVDNKIKKIIFNQTLFFWNRWSVFYHKRMYNLADKIYAHTEAQAEKIKSLVRYPGKVSVIPHGIPEIPNADKDIPSWLAKKELGLTGKFVLGVFGFINKKKGYELILDILGELPENTVLLIAGGPMTENAVDKDYYDRLIKYISSAGLKKKVQIAGYLKEADIPMIMAAVDICLAPFLSGSASGALSLCIGYQKPIIASDIPVHREVYDRLACLELFQYPDARDLLSKIKRLLATRGRIIELSLLTKEYSKRFSYAVIARETVRTYEDMMRVHNNGDKNVP